MRILLLAVLLLAFLTSCQENEIEEDCIEKTWVSIGANQCANAWDNLGLGSTKSNITEYLKRNDIPIYDFKTEVWSYGPFCSACTCPSGIALYILIQNCDIESLEKLGLSIYVIES